MRPPSVKQDARTLACAHDRLLEKERTCAETWYAEHQERARTGRSPDIAIDCWWYWAYAAWKDALSAAQARHPRRDWGYLEG